LFLGGICANNINKNKWGWLAIGDKGKHLFLHLGKVFTNLTMVT
jgi:hypothetical protein